MTSRAGAGLGLKPEHYDAALGWRATGSWFEVHPENYLAEGGPRIAWLEAIRDHHPISLHGVSLSLAGNSPPDKDHLQRLASLATRIEPFLISEHLAWSRWNGSYFPDLLPFPRSHEALARVSANIAETQDTLGRQIAIENPSHYLIVDGHDWSETDFLGELVRRTGCSLLVDVNNIYVSSRNTGTDPWQYLDALPAQHITEIHLAGHSEDPGLGQGLLVDSHDSPVAEPVWSLYGHLLRRIGPRPTLIERDGNLPDFQILAAERGRADAMLRSPLKDAA